MNTGFMTGARSKVCVSVLVCVHVFYVVCVVVAVVVVLLLKSCF